MNKNFQTTRFSYPYFFSKFISLAVQYAVFFAIGEVLSLTLSIETTLFILTLCAVTSICLSWFCTKLLVSVTAKNATTLKENFFRSLLNTELNVKTFYRRIDQNLNCSCAKENFCSEAIIIALAIILCLAWFKFAAIFLVIGAAFVFALMLLLQKASVFSFLECNKRADERNVAISEAISQRFFLLAFDDIKHKNIQKLQKLFRKERFWRSIDSSLKVAETYMGMVIKIAPFAAAGLYALIIGSGTPTLDKTIFWVSLPLFSSITSLPRLFQDLASYKDSREYIKQALIPLNEPSSSVNIIFAEHDNLWNATFSVNLFGDGPLQTQLLKDFNLWSELGLDKTSEPFKEIVINDELSTGQKQRLLLARSLCVATQQGQTLEINANMAGLDPTNAKNIKTKLNAINESGICKIIGIGNIWTSEVAHEAAPNESLEQKSEPIKNIQQNHDQSTGLGRISLFDLSILLLFLFGFIIVALIDSKTTVWINELSILSSKTVLFSTLAFGLALLFGVLLEDNVRRKCFRGILDSIFHRPVPSNKINEGVSIDLDISLENFSYYAHDFIWALSLFFVLAGSLVLSIGYVGLMITVVFSMALLILYKYNYSSISKARESFVSNGKLFSTGLNDLQQVDRIWTKSLSKENSKTIREGMLSKLDFWFNSKINLLWKRTYLSILIQFLFQILIVLFILIYSFSPSKSMELIFVLSVLLSFQGESLRLFVALSGIASTLSSYTRLLDFSSYDYKRWGKFLYTRQALKLQATTSNIGISYQPMEFNPGINWIVGRSGSGKSTLLTELFWNLKDKGLKVSYFKHEEMTSYPDKNSVKGVIENLFNPPSESSSNIVILDEVFSLIEQTDVQETIDSIHRLAQDMSIIVLSVYHQKTNNVAGKTHTL
jgi:ABC-type Mn2+/Zn2+ transport system ATPase subunit